MTDHPTTHAHRAHEHEEERVRPEFGTEDYRRYAVLFNDITFAPTEQFVHFSTRHILADYLWSQGWRRDVRPEDVTPNPRERAGEREAGA